MHSGCIWQPSFSGFYSFRIHCAARKQKDPFPQMVSRDDQLNQDPILDDSLSDRLHLQLMLLQFTGLKPEVFQIIKWFRSLSIHFPVPRFHLLSVCLYQTQGRGDQTQVWSQNIPYICKSEGGTSIYALLKCCLFCVLPLRKLNIGAAVCLGGNGSF